MKSRPAFGSSVRGQDGHGKIGGVGIVLSARQGAKYVVVGHLDPSSIAAKSGGVFPGDYLISVDNEDVGGKDLSYISSKVTGPVGTMVTLVLKAGGKAPTRQVALQRCCRKAAHNESRESFGAAFERGSAAETIAFRRDGEVEPVLEGEGVLEDNLGNGAQENFVIHWTVESARDPSVTRRVTQGETVLGSLLI